MKKKINCEPIPPTLIGKCLEPARQYGKTELTLKHIENMIEQLPKEYKQPKVLIIGNSESPSFSKSMHLYIKALQDANVEIVVLNAGHTMSMGKLQSQILKIKDDFDFPDLTKIPEPTTFAETIETLKEEVVLGKSLATKLIVDSLGSKFSVEYINPYSRTISDPVGKFRRSLEELSKLQKELDKKSVLNFMNGPGKHIPIKGKFTKKGKGGQSGSKFHK